MSEQEKKSDGGTGGSSTVVLVEQSATSKHKQPLRAAELPKEVADLHHKLSKAPTVPPAGAEKLKDVNITNVDRRERRESELAKSSEKHKHAARKLSNTKRRGSSPEAIKQFEIDTRAGSVTPPTQPIPAQVSEASITEVLPEKNTSHKKEENDSITEEITEMRTPEIAIKSLHSRVEEEEGGLSRSESRTSRTSRASRAARVVRQMLCCEKEKKEIQLKIFLPAELEVSNSPNSKRKEVSWKSEGYLKQTKIKDLRSETSVILESKASIGPCCYPKSSFGKPSGISISIPKKSIRSISEMSSGRQSVINISIGKNTLINKTDPLIVNGIYIDKEDKKNGISPNFKFLDIIREKISNIGGRTKNVLNS